MLLDFDVCDSILDRLLKLDGRKHREHLFGVS